MAASTYLDQVQQLYIAYFGRPADPVGQRTWAQVIDDAGGNIANVLTEFAASNESQALYGSSTTAQKVTAIYSNVFNRAPEAAGLAYWIDQINSGKVTQAQAAWSIQQDAGAGDASTVNNKLIAANVFTANLDTNAEITGYSGSTSAAAARAFLNKVDANYASIASVNTYAITDVALVTGTGTVAATPPVQTFFATLTAGEVVFSGSATGDITVAWSGTVGASNAIFARDGISSDAIPFEFLAGARGITLGSNDTLVGSASTLERVETTGAGSAKLTDTPLNLAGKSFYANSSNDVLTLTSSATAPTLLLGLSGFETTHLAGSSALIQLFGGTNTAVDSSAAVSVRLGSGGVTFVGSAGADTIAGGSPHSDILTGGAGIDTFSYNGGNRPFITSMDTITDYRAAGAGADIIAITGIVTVASNISSVENLSAQASLDDALAVSANANTTDNGLVVFLWGGDSYAYIESAGATTTFFVEDTVIKLSGTPFTAGTSIVGLGIDGV